jgi:hypothetical protein
MVKMCRNVKVYRKMLHSGADHDHVGDHVIVEKRGTMQCCMVIIRVESDALMCLLLVMKGRRSLLATPCRGQ